MNGITNSAYLNLVTLGIHVFQMRVEKYFSSTTSQCQTVLFLETTQKHVCILIISFF